MIIVVIKIRNSRGRVELFGMNGESCACCGIYRADLPDKECTGNAKWTTGYVDPGLRREPWTQDSFLEVICV